MYGEELGDVSSVSFYFYMNKGKEIHYSGNIPEDYSVNGNIFKKLLGKLRESIRALWNEFKSADEAIWYTITFTWENNWKFKVEFGYELDKEIGSFEREIIWAYNESGLIPKGEFAKDILNDLLIKKINSPKNSLIM